MRPKYHLGISMAGAVSAGAYTAGVLTQLFETLDAWYKYKSTGITFTTADGEVVHIKPEEMPMHEISVDAFSGASAGSMCTALLAVCLAEGSFDRLYETWVKKVDLQPMLTTSDIAGKEAKLYSLFNAAVIEEIAEGITTFVHDPAKPWPPYLLEQIDMYLTLTNLEGVPNGLSYSSASTANQFIQNYADYRRFTLNKPGSVLGVPPDSNKLDPAAKTSAAGVQTWTDLVHASVASGAFPFGLKPKTLSRRKEEYDKREWYFNYQQKPGTKPEPTYISSAWAEGTPDVINFQYVDGGVMNNEPFELVRRRIAINQGLWRNKTEGNEAAAGVLMVDPFPSSAPGISGSLIKEMPEVPQLFPLLFGSMRNQALFSQDLLYAALDPAVYSRFLVSPTRYELIEGTYTPAAEPLASAILGAFGGFIDESFRNHDYLLGRRNAYDFMRSHFSLPVSNPIVDYVGGDVLMEKYQKAGWVHLLKNSQDVDEQHMLIIPVIPANAKAADGNTILKEPVYPVWPEVSPARLEKLRGLAYQRFERILDVYIDKFTDSWFSEKAFNIAVDKFILKEKWFNKKWDAMIDEPLRKLKLLK